MKSDEWLKYQVKILDEMISEKKAPQFIIHDLDYEWRGVA